jgi:argininosuccinate lyase
MKGEGGTDKPWGGRFTEPLDTFVERFTASVGFDQRLADHDIQGSIAHARMLGKVGVISEAERDAIVTGLEAIRADIASGEWVWSESLEDVHMNIENELVARIGEVGKKLHTGRSRNDQVATDVRLYLRDQIDAIAERIRQVCVALADIAEAEAETLMPGFTHMQVAQPITFGHHMLAWLEMLERDHGRLEDCRRRVNVMPLGSAALAGTSFPLDREFTARELGFESVSRNALDAVSDRDFLIEFCAAASLILVHLSRWSEELVLWASPQFEFVELPDRFCTGSSIMPQKKNPDVPELVRGKSGRVSGHLMALLMLMKGQPLAYNRDNQEDKEPLFDTVDTVMDCLCAYAEMLPAIQIKRENMRRAAQRGFSTATDLADYLVGKGLAFREAHRVVGQVVAHAAKEGKELTELTLGELKRFAAAIEQDAFEVLTIEGSAAARTLPGGTAPDTVKRAARAARARLLPST